MRPQQASNEILENLDPLEELRETESRPDIRAEEPDPWAARVWATLVRIKRKAADEVAPQPQRNDAVVEVVFWLVLASFAHSAFHLALWLPCLLGIAVNVLWLGVTLPLRALVVLLGWVFYLAGGVLQMAVVGGVAFGLYRLLHASSDPGTDETGSTQSGIGTGPGSTRSSSGPETGPKEEKQCIVCVEAPREVALMPCGHMMMCARCTEVEVRRSAACPVCRVRVKHTIKIYS